MVLLGSTCEPVPCNAPASDSWVLGLQICSTTSSSDCFWKAKNSEACWYRQTVILALLEADAPELHNEPGFVWCYYWENSSKHLLTSAGNWSQTKVMIPPKSTPWWTNEFIRVIYRNMGERLLTGEWISQRQLYHWKPNPSWVTSHKRWNLGSLCTTCRQLNRLESLLRSPYYLYNFGRRGACESSQFQGLPETCQLFASWS